MNRSRWNIMKHVRRMAVLYRAILLGLFVSKCAFAGPSDSLTITITPLDINPPAPITDLTAIAGGVGQMLMQWTAPDSNNNVYSEKLSVADYIVKIATFSADSVGNTTKWWNRALDVNGEPTPSDPGTTDSLLLNGLLGGVTYYAAVRSVDQGGLTSAIDVKTATPGQQAFAYIAQSGTGLPPPSNFTGLALSSTSLKWMWDPVPLAGYYSFNDFPSGALVVQTGALTVTESNLTPNKGLTRTVRAGNALGLSNPTAAVTVYTLAAVPTNPSFGSVGFSTITLNWATGGNASGTQYRVERSLDGTNFVPAGLPVNDLTFQDGGLSEQTAYYYRVTAINGDNIVTAPSVIISTVTPLKQDFMPPAPPMGVHGTLIPPGTFLITWEKVMANEDGTEITDLAGYNVYRRSDIGGAASKLTAQPLPIQDIAYATLANNQVYYYTITAIDKSFNESIESLFVDSSVDENVIFFSSGGATSVYMPSSVNTLLQSAHNKYGIPMSVSLREEPIPAGTAIVRSIRLFLVRADTNKEMKDLAFAKPQSVVSIGYNDINGQVATGRPQAAQGAAPSQTTGASPDMLSIYWNNGVTWVKIGGTVDPVEKSVKTKSSYLGNYQLRIIPKATSLHLEQGNVYPRLFTPNGDGYNDQVRFVLENPNNAEIKAEIFDMAGRKVGTPTAVTNTGVGTTLVWDGKDMNGATVPSGAYQYKIQGEGKSFTGTIAVAR